MADGVRSLGYGRVPAPFPPLDHHIFRTRIGTPLDGSNVYSMFQGVLKDADLPRWPFHALRHSAATLMLAQGVPLREIQEVLGHSSIALTANTYAGVMPALKKDAATKMDRALRPARQPSSRASRRGTDGRPEGHR
jgi:integrase